jgi:hypothetical protein
LFAGLGRPTKDGDKFFRGRGVQELGSDVFVFGHPRKRAHADQIVAYEALRNANQKNQACPFLLQPEWNSETAASDGEDNFFHHVGSSMRKGDAMLDHARISSLALHYLSEELVGIRHLFVCGQQADQFADCVLSRPWPQRQLDVFGIKQIGKDDSHE